MNISILQITKIVEDFRKEIIVELFNCTKAAIL